MQVLRNGTEAEEYRRNWVYKIVNGASNKVDAPMTLDGTGHWEQRKLIVGIMIQVRHYGSFRKETLFRSVQILDQYLSVK